LSIILLLPLRIVPNKQNVAQAFAWLLRVGSLVTPGLADEHGWSERPQIEPSARKKGERASWSWPGGASVGPAERGNILGGDAGDGVKVKHSFSGLAGREAAATTLGREVVREELAGEGDAGCDRVGWRGATSVTRVQGGRLAERKAPEAERAKERDPGGAEPGGGQG
jgi:hypothetical protein